PSRLIGGLDGTVQWRLAHARNGGKHALLTAVVGGPGPHNGMSNEDLTELMLTDIRRLYPDWPAPLTTRLVREKNATVAATPESEAVRPKTITPIKGLWLAGDY